MIDLGEQFHPCLRLLPRLFKSRIRHDMARETYPFVALYTYTEITLKFYVNGRYS